MRQESGVVVREIGLAGVLGVSIGVLQGDGSDYEVRRTVECFQETEVNRQML